MRDPSIFRTKGLSRAYRPPFGWSPGRWLRSVGICAALLLLLGSYGAGAAGSGTVSGSTHLSIATTPVFPTPVRHVVVIFMENANASWVLENGSYQRYLAQRYAYASQFYSVKRGSNPNYFAATSGNEWTMLQEYSTADLSSLATSAGLTWGSYEQSMPKPCDAIHPSKTAAYNSGHNPFVWYSNVYSPAAYCNSHDVGFGPLQTALQAGTMPNYALIVANQSNDGHNLCSGPAWETRVNCGDAWLHSFLPPILNSTAAWVRSTLFLITYDEANLTDTRGIYNTTGGGIVYTAAVGDCATPHYTSATPYSTFSLLTTTEWALGLGRTGHHDNWTTHPPMKGMVNSSTCGSAPSSYLLTTGAMPAGGGSVAPPSGSYVGGTTVTLSETPAPGYAFTGWVGSGAGSYTGPNPSPTLSIASNLTETADFALGYPVTFEESGLPAGTVWSVAVGGQSAVSSSSTSIGITEVNGSYSFSVGPVTGYVASPLTGTVDVSGSGTVIPVTFLPGPPVITSFDSVPSSLALGGSTTFQVSAQGGGSALTYTYSGLPAGCASENQSSLSCVPSATGTFTVEVAVSDTQGSAAYANTTLVVGAGDLLSFAEGGLSAGTSWGVTIGATTLTADTSPIDFYLPAGTYRWVIDPPPYETAKKPSGSTSLSASGATVTVNFEHAYLVTFAETGLSPGTVWKVILRTVAETSSTDAITYWTPNGTYAYSIAAVSGYSVSSTPSSVVVAHAPTTISVTFTSTSTAAAARPAIEIGMTTAVLPFLALSIVAPASRGSRDART